MADDKNQKPDEAKNGDGKEPKDQKPEAGGGDKKPDSGDDKGKGDTIPKASYDVVAEKYRKAQAKLDEIEKKRQADEKKQLEEQGKFKELAETAEKQRDEAVRKLELYTKASALKVAALQAGAVDADAVEKLADLTQIAVSEDGAVEAESVTKVVDSLKTSKPYLFGTAKKPNVGSSGGSPDGGAGDEVKTFKRSQLRDSKFYAEHEKDILAAARAGKIEDDVTPQR